MTFTIQLYNKNTGEQRATGNIYAATRKEAVGKALSGVEGAGWTVLSVTRW